MRGVLNNFHTLTIIIVGVGGGVGLTLAAVLVARRLFPGTSEAFEEVADGLRVVYELVFALILAFVIASVLDTFNTADAVVAKEATTLANIKRADGALPIDKQVILDEGLSQYVHAVVEDEWNLMRDGKQSVRAAAGLETLYALYQSYDPPAPDGPQAEFFSQAVSALADATSARRERLQLANAELPALLRLFLPLGAALLLALEYRPKMKERDQFLHMGLLSAVVTFAYLLTILLDYPFAGDVSVSSQPFKEGALAEYWWDRSPHVLGKGETLVPLTAEKMEGVWTSPTFGVVEFRQVGDEIHGVYRLTQGTVVGRIWPDGVFRGWWCQAPTRQPRDDAGDVEWRLVRSAAGETVYGSWRYGRQEPTQGGWDLSYVGGPTPPDMAPLFDNPSLFCRAP